jgi:hypothetical protein
MKLSFYVALSIFMGGLSLFGIGLMGCSNGGGDDFFPAPAIDFLVFTEIEIETRTADTTECREINGINFSFRESEFDKIDPLPIPGSSLALGN